MIYLILVLSFFQNLSLAEDHEFKANAPIQRPISEERVDDFHILARMGDESSSSGYRQLIIYSPEILKNVQFRVGEAENWNEMMKFKSDTHKAYGTKSFLPAAPGQKFTLRGIREDGARVTSLLMIDPKDPKTILVTTLKVEAKGSYPEEKKFDVATGTSSVLAKAQANIGHRLGSGDCSALRGSGPSLGMIGGGGAGLERLIPGQVLRLSPGAGLQGSMGYFRAGGTGHYIVVESVSPNGQITFLDQNWAGGSSSGQFVRRANANLRTLNGSATIYSGN